MLNNSQHVRDLMSKIGQEIDPNREIKYVEFCRVKPSQSVRATNPNKLQELIRLVKKDAAEFVRVHYH